MREHEHILVTADAGEVAYPLQAICQSESGVFSGQGVSQTLVKIDATTLEELWIDLKLNEGEKASNGLARPLEEMVLVALNVYFNHIESGAAEFRPNVVEAHQCDRQGKELAVLPVVDDESGVADVSTALEIFAESN